MIQNSKSREKLPSGLTRLQVSVGVGRGGGVRRRSGRGGAIVE